MQEKDTQIIQKRFDNVKKSKTFEHILRTFDLCNKSVLDMGCSYGEFLANFGENSVGLTITDYEAEYGKSVGLDIRVANIEEYNVNLNKRFDVIFANNIFEHLYSPHSFLIETKKYLKEDGILILGVPVIPRPTFLLKTRKFRGSLAVSHINFFTANTLKITVKRAGWQIIDSRSFYFLHRFFDKILFNITPHIYVVAHSKKDFLYHPKRLKEIDMHNHRSKYK